MDKTERRDPGPVLNSSEIRCPECGTTWEPNSSDEPDLFEPGSQTACCGSCGHEFEVEVDPVWWWRSPARNDVAALDIVIPDP